MPPQKILVSRPVYARRARIGAAINFHWVDRSDTIGWNLIEVVHMRGVTRLRTRVDRLRADQALALRQTILDMEGLPPRAVGEVVAAIDRETATTEAGWTFVMISPAQNSEVVNWLVAHSIRPLVAVRLWATLFAHLRRDTGEVVMTRDQMAGAVGDTPAHVSALLGELEGLGVISRRRERVTGMRGPGAVRVFMNPLVGTHLAGPARDLAQSSAPALRLVPQA